ncbi:MAG: 3'-5' exonuclease [Candidatus Uhrbacteria bacterium]|nr:3'-5' exonuclease [Candidatus Uhrbacteria bacterium]
MSTNESNNQPAYITPIKNIVFTSFDFETTGLYPEISKPIELGAIKFQVDENGDMRVLGTFSSLINPYSSLPPKITTLTEITDEMLKDAPEIFDVFQKFALFTEGTDVFIGHNVLFDIHFLGYNARIHGVFYRFEKPFIDERDFMRIVVPGLPSYHKQGILAKTLDIPFSETEHRARADAELTAKLFVKELEILLKQNKNQPLRWEHIAVRTLPMYMRKEYPRVFEENNSGGNETLPETVDEDIARIGYDLYKNYRPSSLKDIANIMGVEYSVLKKYMKQKSIHK